MKIISILFLAVGFVFAQSADAVLNRFDSSLGSIHDMSYHQQTVTTFLSQTSTVQADLKMILPDRMLQVIQVSGIETTTLVNGKRLYMKDPTTGAFKAIPMGSASGNYLDDYNPNSKVKKWRESFRFNIKSADKDSVVLHGSAIAGKAPEKMDAMDLTFSVPTGMPTSFRGYGPNDSLMFSGTLEFKKYGDTWIAQKTVVAVSSAGKSVTVNTELSQVKINKGLSPILFQVP